MIRLYLPMFGEAPPSHVNHVFGVVVADHPLFAPSALHDALASNLHPAVFLLTAYVSASVIDALDGHVVELAGSRIFIPVMGVAILLDAVRDFDYGGMEDAQAFLEARYMDVAAILEIGENYEKNFFRQLLEDAGLDRGITGRVVEFILYDPTVERAEFNILFPKRSYFYLK
jgi:hypothetical protein